MSNKKIVAPMSIDYGNGTNKFLIAGDAELILSTDDATSTELEEIISAFNGRHYANLFNQELLDSVETLSGIAEEHGARTLADLMYLQNAILNGGFIDHYPEESKVLEIACALPSGERWSKFIKVEYMLDAEKDASVSVDERPDDPHLPEFHKALQGGYKGSFYEWHQEHFGSFWCAGVAA